MKDIFHASEKKTQYFFTIYFLFIRFFNNFLLLRYRSAFSYLIVYLEVGKKCPKMAQNAKKHWICLRIVSINGRSELIFGENDENVARHKKP